MDDTPWPLPRSIGSPATRALTVIGVADLRDLTRMTEAELLALHGVGPTAVSRLREALAEHGSSFAPSGPRSGARRREAVAQQPSGDGP